jgi:hypothetical protein
MKQPGLLLKSAVIASAVVLVGGFVSYRAGAFDWLVKTSPPAAEATPTEAPPPAPEPESTILPSTKSFSPTQFIKTQ